MKKRLLNNKGITLTSLAIAITVILILTGVLIYNVKDNLIVANLKKMQNDVENLRDTISNYYAINGAIPAKIKYTNEENLNRIKNAGVISESVDTGDFYIIDLKELENLTLNYGEDYKNITESTTEEEASQYSDIYIINEDSQNIFYVAGIVIDNEWFYTDYTRENVDKQKIDLIYISLEHAKNDSMLDKYENSKIQVPDGEFILPGGFKVAEDSGNTIDEGIVIEDRKSNQFVWIPVDNFSEFKRYDFKNNTEVSSIYTEASSDGIKDTTEVEKMYKSVKENKGFYVARYEAGTTVSSDTGIRGEVVSKKGANIYNNIKWGNSMDETGGAVEVARSMYNKEKGDNVTSTLIYGVQWDAIMRWMKDVPNQTGGKYVEDSTGMGWYSNNYSSGNPTHQTGIELEDGKNKIKNIYDLAGNIFEWTMEFCGTGEIVVRGGVYGDSGSERPASSRYTFLSKDRSAFVAFRVTLYL